MSDPQEASGIDEASESQEAPVQRTAAFFADPRAATLLLKETVEELIEARKIQFGLIDLSTLAGLAVADAFDAAGVLYTQLDYGQDPHYDVPSPDSRAPYSPLLHEDRGSYVARAGSSSEINVGEFGSLDANVVLIPAMVDVDEKLVDFSQGSLIGTVYTQLEEAGRDVLIVDTPERGLRSGPEGAYLRAIMHVRAPA